MLCRQWCSLIGNQVLHGEPWISRKNYKPTYSCYAMAASPQIVSTNLTVLLIQGEQLIIRFIWSFSQLPFFFKKISFNKLVVPKRWSVTRRRNKRKKWTSPFKKKERKCYIKCIFCNVASWENFFYLNTQFTLTLITQFFFNSIYVQLH